MIVAKRKDLEEIMRIIEPFERIIVAGCNGCVAVCQAGGAKEVEELAAVIRMKRKNQGRPIETLEITLERQCDPEYLEPLRRYIKDYQAILSTACGAGVQFVAEKFPEMPVLPALDTVFIGVTEEHGVWGERCQACGNCVLYMTGGICPITRCSKSLLNGPCGGSVNGKCEVNPDIPCGWQLIIDRLKALNMLDVYDEIIPMKDWRTSRDGGPRKVVREDLKL